MVHPSGCSEAFVINTNMGFSKLGNSVDGNPQSEMKIGVKLRNWRTIARLEVIARNKPEEGNQSGNNLTREGYLPPAVRQLGCPVFKENTHTEITTCSTGAMTSSLNFPDIFSKTTKSARLRRYLWHPICYISISVGTLAQRCFRPSAFPQIARTRKQEPSL